MLDVMVLSIPGCEAGATTLKLVQDTANEIGISMNLSHVVVSTQAEAEKHRFLGSPSVRIRGMDIDPAMRAERHFGVT